VMGSGSTLQNIQHHQLKLIKGFIENLPGIFRGDEVSSC